MKLDKPTVTALAVFLAATLGVIAADLSGRIGFPAAIAAEQPIVMALLVALGIVSHGTPAETTAPDAPEAKKEDPTAGVP